MKVKELIEELEQYDPEEEVHICYNYGDHCQTLVAPKVEVVEQLSVKYSEYHKMPRVVEDDEDEDEYNPVVVLTAF